MLDECGKTKCLQHFHVVPIRMIYNAITLVVTPEPRDSGAHAGGQIFCLFPNF